MTQAPYLLPGARAGYRLGDQSVVDSMMYDGLSCAFDHCAMGLSTERHNDGRVTRARQDEFAARSHQLAAAAIAAGRFDEEIVTVAVPQRKGDPVPVALRRGRARRHDGRVPRRAAPGLRPGGTVTAGNASQISDGGAAVLVMSAERAEALGLDPIGEILGYGQVAGPDASLLTQPSNAIRQAAAARRVGARRDGPLRDQRGLRRGRAWRRSDDLGLDEAKVNVNGGAIALGHPIGMSGTRLAITALGALRRRGGGVAAVALCGGGGQGDAAILRSL